MIDEMSGFADLPAILIEKYASELDVSPGDQDSMVADKKILISGRKRLQVNCCMI